MTRGALLGIAYAAIVIAVVAARPPATPGPIARDFEAYWSAGVTANDGADPYGRAIWRAERRVPGVDASRDELLPFIGPPATLPVWRALARLAFPAAAAIWLALLGVVLIALVVIVLHESKARWSWFAFAAALAIAVAFGPITSDIALGQLALPAVLGCVLLVALSDRTIAGAAFGSVLAFSQPNVALGLASQVGRNRATFALAGGALFTYLLGAVAAGWNWPLAYARAAVAHGSAEATLAIQLSPRAIAAGFGALPSLADWIGIAVAVVAVAAAIALVVRIPERFARFAACSALVPFVASFSHEHDLVVAYPAAVWCALRTRGATRAIALLGTLLVAIDWLGLAQRPGGIAQSALLAIAAAAALVAVGSAGDTRASAYGAAAGALLFGLAAWLASAHPAPVWPDALRAFHAAPGANASQVWFAEQRATGLLAPTPAWAILRSLSLLGCALLAAAIYRRRPSDRTA